MPRGLSTTISSLDVTIPLRCSLNKRLTRAEANALSAQPSPSDSYFSREWDYEGWEATHLRLPGPLEAAICYDKQEM